MASFAITIFKCHNVTWDFFANIDFYRLPVLVMSNDNMEIGNLKQKSPIKVGKFHGPNNL